MESKQFIDISYQIILPGNYTFTKVKLFMYDQVIYVIIIRSGTLRGNLVQIFIFNSPTFGQTYTCVCNGQSSIIAQLYWDIIFEPLDFEAATISFRLTLHHGWLFFLHRLQFRIDDNFWIALWKLCKDKEEIGEILAMRFIQQWYTCNNFVYTNFLY